MAPKRTGLQNWIRHTLASEPPRSKSLIITLFGDSLLPRASGVWLSELIALLEPFQVNSQLARTSSFRLAEEGWLQSRREGRRSLYALTETGRQKVEHAYTRIYELPPQDWDGNWTIVILSKSQHRLPARTALRRELEWEGFGLLAPGLFIHPRVHMANLNEVLCRLTLTEDVTILQAHDLAGLPARPGLRLASECWNCDLVAAHYNGFLKRFQAVVPMLEQTLDSQTAFVLQTLLIHAFRRVVLHDPQLPAALLPRDWPGHAAYDLCRKIYRRTFLPAQAHLAAHLDAALQAPLQPGASIQQRLAGLADDL